MIAPLRITDASLTKILGKYWMRMRFKVWPLLMEELVNSTMRY